MKIPTAHASGPIRIGVFDSGLGGLTVLKALRRLLPEADYHYVGDTARVPYGTKSDAAIRRYGFEIANYLAREPLQAIVVACNTVSAVAIDELQAHFPVPVVGMVEAGAGAALAAGLPAERPPGSPPGSPPRIGVICTPATLRSGAYERALRARAPEAIVSVRACPLFVPMVEEGWVEGPVVQGVIDRYLAPLKRERIDTLLLGCTHYPLLNAALNHYFSGQVAIVSSGLAAAESLRERLNLPAAKPDASPGLLRLDLTDAPAPGHAALIERFLGEVAPECGMIDIEKDFR